MTSNDYDKNIDNARNIFMEKMRRHEHVLDHDPILEFIKNDRLFLFQCSKKYPSAIIYANKTLQEDIYFIKQALAARPSLILHLPPLHKDNKNLASMILALEPSLFSYFSEKIRSLPSIYTQIIPLSIQQIKYIPATVFKTSDMMTLLSGIVMEYPEIYQDLPPEIKTKSFSKRLVSINGDVINYLPLKYIDNKLLIMAINNNIDCVSVLSKNLPNIDLHEVLAETYNTLNKYRHINKINDYCIYFEQYQHTQKLNAKLSKIDKSNSVESKPKVKI